VSVETLRVIEIAKTCEASPSQWEGRDVESRPVYIRYRHGYLEIYVGPVNGEIDSAVFGNEIFGKQIGERYDGRLSYEQLRNLTKSIIEFPEDEA
jgi:hypothetical protein